MRSVAVDSSSSLVIPSRPLSYLPLDMYQRRKQRQEVTGLGAKADIQLSCLGDVAQAALYLGLYLCNEEAARYGSNKKGISTFATEHRQPFRNQPIILKSFAQTPTRRKGSALLCTGACRSLAHIGAKASQAFLLKGCKGHLWVRRGARLP